MDSVDFDPVGCAPATEEGQVSQHEQILLLQTLCPHPIVGSALQYKALSVIVILALYK